MKSCLLLACLVYSGALLVSVNIKLAEGLQTVKTLVFGLRYAGWSLQLSNVKPTQVSNGSTSKEIMSSWQPLKRPTYYYNNGVLAVSFTKLSQ
jgi:hypothetical protein